MKQFTTIIIKIIGFILLIDAVYLFFSVFPIMINGFVESYYGVHSIVYVFLPTVCLLLFSYWSIYKTDSVLKFLKMDVPTNAELVDDVQLEEEKPTALSKETLAKSGVFLIGVFLLAFNAPNVIVRVVQWLTQELSQVKANSLDDLLNMISPYNSDTLLYSLAYAVAGYFIAVWHTQIANYLLKRSNKGIDVP